MSDLRTRTAERRAALTGSPEDRAQALRERLRSQDGPCGECGGRGASLVAPPAPGYGFGPCSHCAGTGLLLRPRVELAAYCGDEGAEEVFGPAITLGDFRVETRTRSFEKWVAGLSCWSDLGPPPGTMVRAAVAAGRVAFDAIVERTKFDARPIEQIHADLREPGHAIEAAEAYVACPCEEHRLAWLVACRMRAYPATIWLPCPCLLDPREQVSEHHFCINAAARLTGEQPVREAISRALIKWALP